MSSLSSSVTKSVLLVLFIMAASSTLTLTMAASAIGNFYSNVDLTGWGSGERAKILQGGQLLTLSMDNASGCGFQSKDQYLFGRIDVQIKLVPGDSSGTVTTFYLSSQGDQHDEVDFEFLGNQTGQPFTVHTNIFANGTGGREQQYSLWFDPTISFHMYSVVWNPQNVIWMVDNIPIRVFKNNEAIGVPFPHSQPMTVYASLWDGDSWATQGGRVKTNWTQAPFTASYKDFNPNANCVPSSSSSGCGAATTTTTTTTGTSTSTAQAWQTQQLNARGLHKLRRYQSKYCIYNYCTDNQRFPKGPPLECNS